MRFITRLSLLLISLGAMSILAQGLHHFDHIIIVFQENRTPDNLFGSTPGSSLMCGSSDPFEHGVDIENCGMHYGTPQWLQPLPLGSSVNPGHNHGPWLTECDPDPVTGACHMDQTCGQNTGWQSCFAYVQASDVAPYFDIAEKYGFANYMFQTNQGPSFPAHQFIFAGTSAPVPYNDPSGLWTWFAADNPEGILHAGDNTGCTAPSGEFIRTIDPAGNEKTSSYCSTHSDKWCSKPCYEHASPPYSNGSLADLLESNHISWKYYTPKIDPNTGAIKNGLWVAPIAIKHLCGQIGTSGKCDGLLPGGAHYANMRYETTANPYPLKDDIDSCNLAAVNWAIPDKKWSDHGGEEPNGLGPAYVANIINALGNSHNCDGGAGYWNNTAVFITWDDWGGWFDHVPPFSNLNQQNCNQWGCNYVYGFRVPLLVVSAYTPPGYVSGALPPYGNGEDPIHTHDFGSMLAFIENNFGLPIGSIGPTLYPFADAFAPDHVQGNIPCRISSPTHNQQTSWRSPCRSATTRVTFRTILSTIRPRRQMVQTLMTTETGDS